MTVTVAQSCPTLCNLMHCTVDGILQARMLEWVAVPFSRGIFPTQGSNPGLLHCRQILYQLSHKSATREAQNHLVCSHFTKEEICLIPQSLRWKLFMQRYIVVEMALFCSLCGLVIFYCIYASHHLYPFFHDLLAIINNIAMNIEVHASF